MLFHFLVLLSSLCLQTHASKRSALGDISERSQKIRRKVIVVRDEEFINSCHDGRILYFQQLLRDLPGYFDHQLRAELRERCLLVAIQALDHEFVKLLLNQHFDSIPITAIHRAVCINNGEMLREIMYSGLPLCTEMRIDDPTIYDIAGLAIDYRNLDILRQIYQISPFRVDLHMVFRAANKSRPELLKFLLPIAIATNDRDMLLGETLGFICARKSTCSMRFALSQYAVIPENNAFLSFSRPFVRIYKLITSGCTIGDIDTQLGLVDGEKPTLFIMALKTAIGIGNIDLTCQILQLNRDKYGFRVSGLGAEILNVAATTGQWTCAFSARVREPLIAQWHFNGFLRERLKHADYETLLATLDHAPDFMRNSWRMHWQKNSFQLKKLELIEAAKSDWKPILKFAANYPEDHSIVEYAWRVFFDPVNENFVHLLTSALVNQNT